MRSILRPLYQLHGCLAERHVMSGEERVPFALRAVRLVLDAAEMGRIYGWRGVLDVVRERLGLPDAGPEGGR